MYNRLHTFLAHAYSGARCNLAGVHASKQHGNLQQLQGARIASGQAAVVPLSQQISSYSNLMQSLLRFEVQGDVASLRQRLLTWPLLRLSREGLAIADLVAVTAGISPRRGNRGARVVLAPRQGGRLPFHRFTVGDVVFLTRGSGGPLSAGEGGLLHGVVARRSAKALTVALRRGGGALDVTGFAGAGTWRVDAGWSDVTYSRMVRCLAFVTRQRHGARSGMTSGPPWLLPYLLHASLEHSAAGIDPPPGNSDAPPSNKAPAQEAQGTSSKFAQHDGVLGAATALLQSLTAQHPRLAAVQAAAAKRSPPGVPWGSDPLASIPRPPPLAVDHIPAATVVQPHPAEGAPTPSLAGSSLGGVLQAAMWRPRAADEYATPQAYAAALGEAVACIKGGLVASAEFTALVHKVQVGTRGVSAGDGSAGEDNLPGHWHRAAGIERLLKWLPATLNPSQMAAIAVALLTPLSVIQGPPGTGKTTTAASLIRAWSAAAWHEPEETEQQGEPQRRSGSGGRRGGPPQPPSGMSSPALVVAPSNVAIDNLLESLCLSSNARLKLIRIGDRTRMSATARQYSLQAAVQAHPDFEVVARLRAQAVAAAHVLGQRTKKRSKKAAKTAAAAGLMESAAFQSAMGDAAAPLSEQYAALEESVLDAVRGIGMGELRDRAEQWNKAALERERALERDVLKAADVVLSTANGSGANALDGIEFGLVLVDEAAQLHDLDALVPACRGASSWNTQVVLMGDSAQLPPTVHSRAAHALTYTLLQRAEEEGREAEGGRKATGEGVSNTPLGQALLRPEERDPMDWALWAGGDVEACPVTGVVRSVTLPPSLTSQRTGMATPVPAWVQLQQQYRMAPMLACWPSWAFYSATVGSALSCGAPMRATPPPGLPWPLGGRSNIMLLPVLGGGGESNAAFGTSKRNTREAQVAVAAVARLLSKGAAGSGSESAQLTPGDIGVVTPYLAQVRAIADALRRKGIPVMEGGGDEALGGGRRAPKGGAVEVRSVDGFQGRQKRCIVMSAVRSNGDGEVGFLADARRLNVALTRAQSALVVACDPLTVRSDAAWGAWCNWAVKNKLVVLPGALGVGDEWTDRAAEYSRWQEAVSAGLLSGTGSSAVAEKQAVACTE